MGPGWQQPCPPLSSRPLQCFGFTGSALYDERKEAAAAGMLHPQRGDVMAMVLLRAARYPGLT